MQRNTRIAIASAAAVIAMGAAGVAAVGAGAGADSETETEADGLGKTASTRPTKADAHDGDSGLGESTKATHRTAVAVHQAADGIRLPSAAWLVTATRSTAAVA